MKHLYLIALALISISCSPSNNALINLFIGSYTDTNSAGIYMGSLNQETGDFTITDSIETSNPSYISISSDGTKIFSVNENDSISSKVVAFNYDKEKHTASEINSLRTTKASPCYIETNDNALLVANFGGCITYYPLGENGNILAPIFNYEGEKIGAEINRQASPHLHTFRFIPNSNELVATDFTGDKLIFFNQPKAENDSIKPTYSIDVEKLTGPRHIAFGKNGQFMYVIGEISGKITCLEKVNGKYNIIQTIAADTVNGQGSADIHIAPNGKYLYASNRLKNDGIAIFQIGQDGKLEAIGYQNTGIHPRNFAITPNGKFLLVACRDSNLIQIFEINPKSGLLKDTNKRINLDKPTCIKFR